MILFHISSQSWYYPPHHNQTLLWSQPNPHHCKFSSGWRKSVDSESLTHVSDLLATYLTITIAVLWLWFLWWQYFRADFLPSLLHGRLLSCLRLSYWFLSCYYCFSACRNDPRHLKRSLLLNKSLIIPMIPSAGHLPPPRDSSEHLKRRVHFEQGMAARLGQHGVGRMDHGTSSRLDQARLCYKIQQDRPRGMFHTWRCWSNLVWIVQAVEHLIDWIKRALSCEVEQIEFEKYILCKPQMHASNWRRLSFVGTTTCVSSTRESLSTVLSSPEEIDKP